MKGFGRIQPKVLGTAIAAFVAGASIFASPVPQAIAAVIATDVQCTGCVGANDLASSAVTTTKLASNSVNGAKISDGTISAADLGADSVGASEIKGVSKLMIATCTIPATSMGAGAIDAHFCTVSGVDSNDFALAQNNHFDSSCIEVTDTLIQTNNVIIVLHNQCAQTTNMPATEFGIWIWDN